MSVSKIITVCKCPSCDEPVKVPIKLLGQLIAKQRKTNNSSEFMSKIATERHQANRAKKI